MSGGSHCTANVSHIARDGGMRYARRGVPAPTLIVVPAGSSITPARPFSSRYCEQNSPLSRAVRSPPIPLLCMHLTAGLCCAWQHSRQLRTLIMLVNPTRFSSPGSAASRFNAR